MDFLLFFIGLIIIIISIILVIKSMVKKESKKKYLILLIIGIILFGTGLFSKTEEEQLIEFVSESLEENNYSLPETKTGEWRYEQQHQSEDGRYKWVLEYKDASNDIEYISYACYWDGKSDKHEVTLLRVNDKTIIDSVEEFYND